MLSFLHSNKLKKGCIIMDLKNKTILFLGDSITEGHGTTDTSKRFTDLVSARLGAKFVNYGIGGTRYARQHNYNPDVQADKDFCMRAPEMQQEADCIVVFGGTNDYDHGDAPFGCFTDRTPMTFYGALHTVYTTLIEKYAGVPIIVITPLHRTNEDNGIVSRAYGYKPLKDYVNAIREVAEYYSLPVLDFYANSGMQPNVEIIKQKYVPDGLHPNDAGHEIMANMIVNFLKAL